MCFQWACMALMDDSIVCTYAACTMHVCVGGGCVPYVWWACTICVVGVYCMCGGCVPYVWWVCTVCVVGVYRMCGGCVLYVW